jgi:hypothetical protein
MQGKAEVRYHIDMGDYQARYDRLVTGITAYLGEQTSQYIEEVRLATRAGLDVTQIPYSEEEFQEQFLTMLEFHLQVLVDRSARAG